MLTTTEMDNLVQETINELWRLSDELMAKGKALDPEKSWERNCFFMQAVGVGDATKKVIELGSKLRKAYYDKVDKETEEARKKWSEQIDLREQEITYNRINGIS